MPRGDKSKYTGKQERKADHIAEGYEKRGVGKKEAEDMILSARVLAGWITAEDLAPEAVEEDAEAGAEADDASAET